MPSFRRHPWAVAGAIAAALAACDGGRRSAVASGEQRQARPRTAGETPRSPRPRQRAPRREHDPRAADAELRRLYDAVAADLEEGRPLVVQVHVPLCDNHIIDCGNARLGDGDNPDTNLYWATSEGFTGWFRKKRGWTTVLRQRPPGGDVLERRVWKKRVQPTRAWRERGVRQSFDVYVVAFAWRGSAINRAIDSYVRDLYGDAVTTITTDDGTVLAAGGAARVVAYVGHNGWMDIGPYDWRAAERMSPRAPRTKGTIAVACSTAAYLAKPVSSPDRVPLLMTTSLMFAGAHSFEQAVSAFAAGQAMKEIRWAAARGYAEGQKTSVERVQTVFVNPADQRWPRYFER